MKMLLLEIVCALNVHVVTGQCAIDGPIGIERQAGSIHDWFLPNAMPKAYTMALLTKCSGIICKLALGGPERKPALQFFHGSDMTDGTVALISMRIFDVDCFISGFTCRTAICC